MRHGKNVGAEGLTVGSYIGSCIGDIASYQAYSKDLSLIHEDNLIYFSVQEFLIEVSDVSM